MRSALPPAIAGRTDKMGFPVPFSEWMRGDANQFLRDVLTSGPARQRGYIDNAFVAEQLDSEPRFGRKVWGLLSLELWQQEFHDRQSEFQGMLASSHI